MIPLIIFIIISILFVIIRHITKQDAKETEERDKAFNEYNVKEDKKVQRVQMMDKTEHVKMRGNVVKSVKDYKGKVLITNPDSGVIKGNFKHTKLVIEKQEDGTYKYSENIKKVMDAVFVKDWELVGELLHELNPEERATLVDHIEIIINK